MEIGVAIVVAVVTVIVLFALRFSEFRSLQRSVSRVPRAIMPLLRRGDLPGRQSNAIISALVRSREQLPPVPVPSSREGEGGPPPGLLGWSEGGDDMPRIHFKTTIARMHEQFERCAVMRDPGMARPPWMCVRDYCEAVAPSSGRGTRFAMMYEVARFSNVEFTPTRAREIIGQMATIIEEEFPEESKKAFGY